MKNDRPIIIGFGPAGMFAALALIERGIKPLIFERGKKIEERSVDRQKFIEDRILDTESNIQFGEGGAGSYSDGKLFSRVNNSKHADEVLKTFVKFGAPENIIHIRKPHLGTDVLCRIVVNIRNHILERGGEIFYGSKMTDLIIADEKAVGVIINDKKEYYSSAIYLAVGHSARDVFGMMSKKGVSMEQKPISVGVRIEHPAKVINLLRNVKEGAGQYSFTYTDRKLKRGVYTFCMCPGGEIINASSENGMLALNGMSGSRRDSDFSNSAIIVSCHTEDYGSGDPTAGIEFQRKIERRAFELGGKSWKAPAQNLSDFISGKLSKDLNKNSYKMGAEPAPLREIFPEFVNDLLISAFDEWKKDYPLFVSDDAVLLGAESRTSCAVRIKRNDSYESVNIKNLYPIGEGSGYTGGIMSSAMDGMKAVEK